MSSSPWEQDMRMNRPERDANKAHVALTLVLDVSGSMSYSPTGGAAPIDLLNDSINEMVGKMNADSRLNTIVDLSIFTFGAPGKENPYIGFMSIVDVAKDVGTIRLEANDGYTYIADVLKEAIEATRERANSYRTAYKPWIVVISDGGFSDNPSALDEVGEMMKQRARDEKQNFFGFFVPEDTPQKIMQQRQQLEKFCLQEQAQIRVVDIKDAGNLPKLLEWIGRSMKKVSGTDPTQKAGIENPSEIFV